MAKRAIITLCAAAFIAGMAIGDFKPVPIINSAFTQAAPAPEVSPLDSTFYRLREPLFTAFAPTTKIVMAGDSLTDLAEWSDIFPGVSISNRGIYGDTSEGLLARVDQITMLHPEKAFLMIGINDLGVGHSIARIMTAYTEIIRRLHSVGIFVFVQSTLFAAQDSGLNGNIEKLNAALEQFCKNQLCTFIDLNIAICPKGFLDKSTTVDGLHLNSAGYMLWRNALRPYL